MRFAGSNGDILGCRFSFGVLLCFLETKAINPGGEAAAKMECRPLGQQATSRRADLLQLL